MNPVLLNTLFEAIGAVLAGRSAYLASKVKPAGISYSMVAFSGLWAVECCFYYHAHQEFWAALFAVLRCAALVVWCLFAVRKK